jgi:hypothetical protein
VEFKVDGWNNFCRVFELPEKFSSEYCFGGGIPTMFIMVDWFNPVSNIGQPAVSKEVWKKEVGEIEIKEVTEESLSKILFPFLQEKEYTKKGRQYLIICDFGLTLLFDCK